MKLKYGFIVLLSLAACGPKPGKDTNTTGGGTGGDTTGGSTGNGPTTRFIGRVGADGTMAWSATGAETKVKGPATLMVNLANQTPGQSNHMEVMIDGKGTQEIVIEDATPSYSVSVPDGLHTVQVVKRTEAGDGVVIFKGFSGATLLATDLPTRLIEFVGDSITAGYGDEENSGHGDAVPSCPAVAGTLTADPNLENALDAYGPVSASALKADWSLVAWSGKGVSMNRASDSSHVLIPALYPLVNPSDMSSSYDFKAQADVVVVNLGTNDLSNTPLPDQTTFVTAYSQLVNTIRSKYANAHIILCVGPMFPLKSAQLTAAQTYVQAVQAAAGGDAANVHYFEFTPNPGPYGCQYHPSADTQKSMAQALQAEITKVTNWK